MNKIYLDNYECLTVEEALKEILNKVRELVKKY